MSADPDSPARAIKVLHVEDSEIDAELIARQLKRHGLVFACERVSTEAAFRQALALFVPDIILSDYSMPEFDGPRALELARELAGATPFIFMSGSNRLDDVEAMLSKGAADFIVKDDLTRLGPAIEKALRRSRAQDGL